MYEGKSHTLFAKYAVPQMIGLLFNSVYMIVDGVFIGNRLGRDAMAAAAVSVPLVEILIALSMAVATGAGVLISSHLGQGEKEKARHIFSLATLCTAIMGLLISVLGNIFIHQLAELLGSTPVIHDEAISYMWYIITFSPFLLFSFLLSGLVRNDNRPKLAMFDCQPSLGMLTVNALAAANRVIIPVQAEYLPAKGLEQLLQTISKVKRQINPKLQIDGILLTMVDNRTNFAKEIAALLRETYGSKIKVFGTEIPHSVRAKEISAEGKSIFAHDPNGKVAEGYKNLTQEVMKLEKQREKSRAGLGR